MLYFLRYIIDFSLSLERTITKTTTKCTQILRDVQYTLLDEKGRAKKKGQKVEGKEGRKKEKKK